jgi:hypothetical protein
MSIETPIGSTGAMPDTGQSGSPGADTGVKQAAQQATEQTKAVASEAKEHMSQLLGQTRGEVRSQVEQRSQQLTSGLNGLAGQLRSLRSGRPDEAGALHHYLVDAERRVSGWAQRLEHGGPEMLLRDVRSFARRKPGAFLLAAVGAGFAAGRLVRVGMAAAQEPDEETRSSGLSYRPTGGESPPNAMPPGTVTDPALGAPISPTIDPRRSAGGSEAFA